VKRLLLCSLVALTGCFDFTSARAKCAEAGACVGQTPPSLVSSTPAANATHVAVGTAFTLTFSEAMDEASVKLSLSPAVTVQAPAFASADTVATFTTGAPLAAATSYTATVTGQSQAGVELGSTQFTFTTADAVDTTAPTLTSTPANGSSGVPVSTHLVLLFSEPMAPASLSLSTQPQVDWGAVSWNTQNTTATFATPPSSLLGNTGYAVVVSATDVAGNALSNATATITFTTSAAPDTTPPTVVDAQPASGSSGVNVSSDLQVSFSEPMDRTAANVFSVSPSTGCTPTFDASNTVLLCHPSGPLAYATQYTVTVSTNAKDAAGNALAAPFSFSFITAQAPDTTAPTIVSSPANGASNVALDAGLVLTFSEPVDETSLSIVTAGFDWGAPAWNAGGTMASFTPATALDPTTHYTFAILVDDLAGNHGHLNLAFDTQTPPDLTPPQVLGTQPGDGTTNVSVTSDLVITFTEKMGATTTGALTLSPTFAGLTCSLDAATGTVLTCKHTGQPFTASTHYTATLAPAQAVDLAGNPLSGTASFAFTTGTVPDTTPPTIVAVTPLAGAKGVSEGTSFTVQFSEPMDKASAQSALAISAPTGMTFSSFSWSTDGTTVTAYLASATTFPIGATVSWQVSTAAKDLSGNALAVTQQYSFRVAYQKTATLPATLASSTVRSSHAGYSADPANSTYGTTWTGAFQASGGTGTVVMRSVFTFDLTALDATYVSPVTATMTLTHAGTTNTPYGTGAGSMGSLLAERILPAAGSPASTLFTAAPQTTGACLFFNCFTSMTVASVAITSATKTVNALYDVTRTGRSTLTYRFRFTNDTTASAPTGYEGFSSANNATVANRPTLAITYRYAGP
jgi:hypothetical protein